MRIIVMGVSGCGKTTFGVSLADRLRIPFIEGDTLHSARNIEKMSAGTPLTDDDRWPWLDAVGHELASLGNAVASCSALKRAYRDRLRGAAGGVYFVCLALPRTELERRMAQREGHFMPASLLDSQLATLELPTAEGDALIVDGTLPAAVAIETAVVWLAAASKLEGMRA
jgi:gluconokinase